uniref:Uncharacterized protein n=1 Tax=Setaria italica TaxID=4555 RepID=K3ZYW4_SETIT
MADAACVLHHNGDSFTAVPVLLAGSAADVDLRPRLLRRQLLSAPRTMDENLEFLTPVRCS